MKENIKDLFGLIVAALIVIGLFWWIENIGNDIF